MAVDNGMVRYNKKTKASIYKEILMIFVFDIVVEREPIAAKLCFTCLFRYRDGANNQPKMCGFYCYYH
jgi:hypothetical protein